MCGIFASVEQINSEMENLIKNRGKDHFEIIHKNGFYFGSSILKIRGSFNQPVLLNECIFQFNGEIYNDSISDTEFLKNAIEDVFDENSDFNITTQIQPQIFIEFGPSSQNENFLRLHETFEILKKIHLKINEYENEFALVISIGQMLCFFKDDIGKRSLGIKKDPFTVSSVKYEIEIDPLKLYLYDRSNNTLYSQIKKENILLSRYFGKIQRISELIEARHYTNVIGYNKINTGPTKSFYWSLSPVKTLDLLLRDSIKARLTSYTRHCVAFSGGVDSFLIALYTIMNTQEEIILINTAFPDSFDRINGIQGYHDLSKMFPDRSIVLIENDLLSLDIRAHLSLIKDLIYPKTKTMDMNLGIILYFTSICASKMGFKVIYLGAGADEIFGGYNRYKDTDIVTDAMFYDILTISNHNLTRDDRIVGNQNIEARFPFLDRRLILFSFSLSPDNFIKKEIGLIKNKCVLRDLLKFHGFERAASIPKKAMQYGTGLAKIEKDLNGE